MSKLLKYFIPRQPLAHLRDIRVKCVEYRVASEKVASKLGNLTIERYHIYCTNVYSFNFSALGHDTYTFSVMKYVVS